jgi:nitrogen fixation/metabolism regulation signal transduction histidine kinase
LLVGRAVSRLARAAGRGRAAGLPAVSSFQGIYVGVFEKGPFFFGRCPLTRTRGGPPLERRFFFWLFAVGVVPALIVLLFSWWIGAGSLGWLGGLGAWEPVAESGRELFDALAPAAASDTALAGAAERHRTALTLSLTHAQRWAYLGARLQAALPMLFIAVVVLLAALCLVVARKLARGFSRPIRELVDWSGRLGREEPLPAQVPGEAVEPHEIATLRTALRETSVALADASRRRLEAERLRAWAELARRVAHEMKNPLAPLRLAAHRIGRVAGSDAAVAESLEIIGAESARLETLASEFGALGKPPAGIPTAVDVHELCALLLRSDVPPPIETSLTGGSEVITGHYDALLRAFRNVLRNAVDAVSGRAQPRIDVSVTRRGEHVVVAFADNGIGVAAELLERIFDPDVTLKRGGTGLGLAIVRQAVAVHGGSVVARPRAEGGAEFVIELPVSGHSPGHFR